MRKTHRRVKSYTEVRLQSHSLVLSTHCKVSCWEYMTDLFFSMEGTWEVSRRLPPLWTMWDENDVLSAISITPVSTTKPASQGETLSHWSRNPNWGILNLPTVTEQLKRRHFLFNLYHSWLPSGWGFFSIPGSVLCLWYEEQFNTLMLCQKSRAFWSHLRVREKGLKCDPFPGIVVTW
jgi:hypothetical protein